MVLVDNAVQLSVKFGKSSGKTVFVGADSINSVGIYINTVAVYIDNDAIYINTDVVLSSVLHESVFVAASIRFWLEACTSIRAVVMLTGAGRCRLCLKRPTILSAIRWQRRLRRLWRSL